MKMIFCFVLRLGKQKRSSVEDGVPDPNHPPVPTATFAKHVAKLHKSDDRGFMIQYNVIHACNLLLKITCLICFFFREIHTQLTHCMHAVKAWLLT